MCCKEGKWFEDYLPRFYLVYECLTTFHTGIIWRIAFFNSEFTNTNTTNIRTHYVFWRPPNSFGLVFVCETTFHLRKCMLTCLLMVAVRWDKVSSPTRYTWNVDLDRFFQLWNLWSGFSLLQISSWTWLFTTPWTKLKMIFSSNRVRFQIPCLNSSGVHQLQQTLKPTLPLRQGCLHCGH